MAMDQKTPTIEDAVQALREAKAAYNRAHVDADLARKVETDAINKLNAAQRALDQAVEAERGSAPWNTDWHTARRRGEVAEA